MSFRDLIFLGCLIFLALPETVWRVEGAARCGDA
jgi:hypothetical protein